MRLLNRIHQLTRPLVRPDAHISVLACRDCEGAVDHCHHTLVLHADGRSDCEGIEECGADEARHELWLPCTELGCGCTGEEHDLHLAA